jgi:transcriptional regulator with XRE-family HTH domain
MSKGKRRIYSSEALRAEILARTSKENSLFVCSQKELSAEIGFSPAYLNKWLKATLSSDTAKLEALLERWLLSRSLSPRDKRKVLYIESLLSNADNREAVVAALCSPRPEPDQSSV